MILPMILAAALALPSGEQQFDLICTGTTRTVSTTLTGVRTAEFTERAHIDLGRGLWCWDACAAVSTFVEVNDAELVFVKWADDRGESLIRVDRVMGRYTSRYVIDAADSKITVDGTARCIKAPYTPIPEAAF